MTSHLYQFKASDIDWRGHEYMRHEYESERQFSTRLLLEEVLTVYVGNLPHFFIARRIQLHHDIYKF